MGIPTKNGDNILLTGIGVTASRVRFAFRIQLPTGDLVPFAGEVICSTDRTVVTDTIENLPTGEIVAADTRVLANAGGIGEAFVFAELQSKGQNAAFILSGYIYATHTPSFPGRIEGSLEGEGRIVVISLGDPGAGADYTAEAVPTNARWKLYGFSGQLVADANGGDVLPSVEYATSGGNIYSGGAPGSTQSVNITRRWYGSFSPHRISAHGIREPMTLAELFMEEGDTFAVLSDGLTASDDWGEGFIEVMEWLKL